MNPGNQISRIIEILQLFSMGRRLTCSDIRDHFDEAVSIRTIQRDISAIQEAQIPLHKRRGDGNQVTWSFPSSYKGMIMPAIQPNEMLALYILKAYLKTFHGTSIEQDIMSLSDKIEILSPGDVYLDFQDRQELIWDQDTGQFDYQEYGLLLTEIIQHILNKSWVTVTYKSMGEKEAKIYDLFIYYVFHYHGSLYLAAYTPEHHNFITLALHRLERIEKSVNTWAAPPELNITQFREQRFGVFGGSPQAVKLKISPQFTPYFINRNWHPSQNIRHMEDGSLWLEMNVPLSPELISWILSWHEAVFVVEPDALKDMVKERLTKTLEQY